LGSGVITINDNSTEALNDNKWHTINVGRPSKNYHNLVVDHQMATKPSRGSDDKLDLDGILFLGGVKSSMYGKLPTEIVSKFGYQGCLASLDVTVRP
jgi:leucine-rich repeat transmembrane neuronal protein 1/2